MTKKLFLSITLCLTLTGLKATDVVVYDGSANNGTWASWGSATTPCTLTLNGSSAVTTSTNYYLAGKSASLNLSWLSAPNGTAWPWWSLSIAANDPWSAQDISTSTTLRIWLYSSTTIAANALPEVFLKNGNSIYTNNVKLGDYATSGITASTWTKVEIPKSIFIFSSPSTTVDRVIFQKDLDDNVAHTLYIGEIAFSSGVINGVLLPQSDELPYFADGVLHARGVTGEVSIHEITGKLLITKQVESESLAISLKKGCYIMNCSKGSFKFVVQ